MRKIVFFIVFYFLFIASVHAAPMEIVIDADSGRVLYGKNIHQKDLIASTTKIMTALVVIRNANIDEKIKIGKEVNDAYGSAIYIKEKEIIKVKDLLYGLLLRSGNDAALSLAAYTGGSVEGFVSMMNETAFGLGMKDTVFVNPHGLDEDGGNISSVYDMAILMKEAMKYDIFRKITSTNKHIVKTNFNTYEWYNKNKLLTDYKYATGGKIGYTKRAKHTFVSSASKDNKNLIIVTFKDDNQFARHKELYEKIFKRYKQYKVIDKNNLDIDYDPNYKVFSLEDKYILLSKKERNLVKRVVTFYKKKKKKTCIIGKIEIKIGGNSITTSNIYATKEENKKEGFIEKLKNLRKKV